MNKIKYKNKEEWLENRNRGIGGSDAACILGQNKYKSNYDLWKLKVGLEKSEDITYKQAVNYGIEAEFFLRELFKLDFKEEYEVEHDDDTMIIDDEYDFLYASLDGEILEKATGRKGVLEIKTTQIRCREQKEMWSNQIPQAYYIQILHYLMITKYDFAILKAQIKYCIDNETWLKTKHYKIERMDVEEEIEYLREKEIEFWTKYVIKNKRPPLILPEV